jgi:Schlafen, AlbA_2
MRQNDRGESGRNPGNQGVAEGRAPAGCSRVSGARTEALVASGVRSQEVLMTLMSVPIDSITEDHLRSLIENQVIELRVIEYKQELPGKRPEDKREFLADVCSFANTAGGDLVYGMTENGGMPQDLPGFETSNIDDEINGLENSIRDGIGPRIWGVRSLPLRLRSGAHALVLRVPRSFSRPHVVTFRGHWRFYARSSAGKYPMDVDEVRRAFVLSESVADRIRAFRAARLSQVVSGETPVPIEGTSRVVLHVVPISAFDSPAPVVDLDIQRPPLSERVLLPISIVNDVDLDEFFLIRNPSMLRPRYNFDGVFCDTRLGAPVENLEGYAQLFRTGVIEAVDHHAFFEEEGASLIEGDNLDEGLIKAVDRDDLLVPEVLIESLEQDLHALQRHMRPLLDAVWNSVGAPGSPHYDESGNWR